MGVFEIFDKNVYIRTSGIFKTKARKILKVYMQMFPFLFVRYKDKLTNNETEHQIY